MQDKKKRRVAPIYEPINKSYRLKDLEKESDLYLNLYPS